MVFTSAVYVWNGLCVLIFVGNQNWGIIYICTPPYTKKKRTRNQSTQEKYTVALGT